MRAGDGAPKLAISIPPCLMGFKFEPGLPVVSYEYENIIFYDKIKIYLNFVTLIHSFFKKFFVGLYLIYNAVLVSAVQQSESVIHIHIHTLLLFIFFKFSLEYS